jgi:hypothetical protein
MEASIAQNWAVEPQGENGDMQKNSFTLFTEAVNYDSSCSKWSPLSVSKFTVL